MFLVPFVVAASSLVLEDFLFIFLGEVVPILISTVPPETLVI